jgi:hypothetical protein
MRTSTALLTSLSVLATSAVNQVSAFAVPHGNDQLQDRSHVAAYQNEMRRREIIGTDRLLDSYGECNNHTSVMTNIVFDRIDG